MRDASKRSWFDFSTWLQHAEIVSAILLSIASIVTAWSAYQSTRWSGVESTHNIAAASARVESTRAYTMASQRYTIDSVLFSQWVNAYANENGPLERFYRERVMHELFIPRLEEWIASDPLNNPDAQRSPLINEEYHQQLLQPSLDWLDEAEEQAILAQEANGHADKYVLSTVICAMVLFFAGIANKFQSRDIKALMLILATVTLLGAISFVISLPMH